MFELYVDLPNVFQVSASPGQDFGHYMILLHGSETARLIGEIRRLSASHTCIEVQDQISRIISCPLENAVVKLVATLKDISNMAVNGNLIYIVATHPFLSQSRLLCYEILYHPIQTVVSKKK